MRSSSFYPFWKMTCTVETWNFPAWNMDVCGDHLGCYPKPNQKCSLLYLTLTCECGYEIPKFTPVGPIGVRLLHPPGWVKPASVWVPLSPFS